MSSAYPEFRRKLDAVLRRREPAALREFLIAEGQWTQDTATDPERAMWMMIATSSGLSDLHAEASRWLIDHGYAAEARVLGTKGPKGPPRERAPRPRRSDRSSRSSRSSDQRSHHPHGADQRRRGGPGSSRT